MSEPALNPAINTQVRFIRIPPTERDLSSPELVRPLALSECFDWEANNTELEDWVKTNLAFSLDMLGIIKLGFRIIMEGGWRMNPWWTDQQAGLIGGIAGSVLGIMGGIMGTLGGILAPRGQCRAVVFGFSGCIAVAGITAVIGGLVALAMD